MGRISNYETVQGNENTKVIGTDADGKTVNIKFDFGTSLTEAPQDGTPYSRQDGNWVASPNGEVEEAPNDGGKYVRQSEGWVAETVEDGLLFLGSNIVTDTTLIPAHLNGMNEVAGTSSDVTITIDVVSTDDFPVGSLVQFKRTSSDYNVIIAAGTATVENAGRTYRDRDILTLWHKSANVWEILNPPLPLETLTQAEYDALTPEAEVIYLITP